MLVKGIYDEDFVNYKKPAMIISFPKCSFKCDKECGQNVCQNSQLAKQKSIEISYLDVVERYLRNKYTTAIVFGGLEPFDSPEDLVNLIREFRKHTLDDIVIYTGYYEYEIDNFLLDFLKESKNIIVKFGRFIPNSTSIYDEILGIKLASNNQFAKIIS